MISEEWLEGQDMRDTDTVQEKVKYINDFSFRGLVNIEPSPSARFTITVPVTVLSTRLAGTVFFIEQSFRIVRKC